MLVGNVFNFETVFKDGNWNYEMTTDFQIRHQEIIDKYRQIYLANFNKWEESIAFLNDAINKC